MTQKSADLKLHDSLKLLNRLPALHIAIQKAVILNTTCRIVSKFRQNNEWEALGQWDRYCFENRLECCDRIKVDDDDDDDGDDDDDDDGDDDDDDDSDDDDDDDDNNNNNNNNKLQKTAILGTAHILRKVLT